MAAQQIQSNFDSGPKPYWVRYKAYKDTSIKPGIHGKFSTEERARAEIIKAREWFNYGYGKPDAAIVGLWIDKKALAEKEKLEQLDDGLPDADTILESGAAEATPWLVDLIVNGEYKGVEDAEAKAEKLVAKHSGVVTKFLNANGYLIPKLARQIVEKIFEIETNPVQASLSEEVAKLKADNERLLAMIVQQQSGQITDQGQSRNSRPQEVPEEAGVPE